MKGMTTLLAAFVLGTPLLLSAAQDESRKPITRLPADREPTTEKEFLSRAIAAEIAEVKFAEYAAKHAHSEDVRKLAQTLADDHTKIREALLGQAKKHRLAVVEGLEKSHRDEYARLSKLDGAAFDREYLRWVANAHERTSKLYKKWAKDASDEDIRAAAGRALQRVQDHQSLVKKLSGGSRE